MNIHRRILGQTSLAKFYAKDGAFRTAARVLRELADEMVDHADRCDAAYLAEVDAINLQGSGPSVIEERKP